MFRTGHRTDPSSSMDLPARATGEQSEAILGRGVAFDGTLRFTGTLRIEGSFKGHILAGDVLVIGDGADVSADISCGSITVTGEARGSLTAARAIELRAPARVTADVTTPSLIVGEGVLLDGTVKMRGAPVRPVRHDRPRRPSEDSSA